MAIPAPVSDLIQQFSAWLNGSSVQFRVTPEALNSQAAEVQQQVARLRQDFASIESRMAAMRGFWQGEAADAHVESYHAVTAEADQLLAALDSYAVRLNAIAGNYTAAEQAIHRELDSLPADIIQ